MKQSQPQRKPRPRSNNRKPGSRPQSNSGRVENRVRGNPKQLLDKYKTQARESHQGGDRIQSEFYLQFADHYQRVMNEMRLGCGGVFEDYREVARRPAQEISDDDTGDNPYGDSGGVDNRNGDSGDSLKQTDPSYQQIDGEKSVSSDAPTVRKKFQTPRERPVRHRSSSSGEHAVNGVLGANSGSLSGSTSGEPVSGKGLVQDQSDTDTSSQGSGSQGPTRRQRAEVAEQSERRQRRPYRSREQNREQNGVIASNDRPKDVSGNPVSTSSEGLSDENTQKAKLMEGEPSPNKTGPSPKVEDHLPQQSQEITAKPLRRRIPRKPTESDLRSPETAQAAPLSPEAEVKPKRRGRPRKVDVQAALALEAKALPLDEKSSAKKATPASTKETFSDSSDNSGGNSGSDPSGGGVTKENAA